MLNWHDWAACCVPILDTKQMTNQSKFTICADTEYPATKLQQFHSVLDTIDISRIQFINLELKDLVNTGALRSRTSSWKWNLD